MKITNENLDCTMLSLYMHNVCNYRCSYCAPHHYNGDKRWPEDIEPYLNFLKEIKKTNKYTYIEIFGGEPTMWPKFDKFIEAVSDETTLLEIDTNASRTLRYWEKFDSSKCFMLLSWHYETANDDHFFNVAKILSEKGPVHVPLLTTPENFERAKALYNRFESSNLEIHCQPKFVRVTIGSSEYLNYTTEQRDWMSKAGFNRRKPFNVDWDFPHHLKIDDKLIYWSDIANNEAHRFKDWICKAGINRFFVEPDGNIARCSKHVGGSLGNIFTGYKLPTDPVVCSKMSCACKVDAIVEKWTQDIEVDSKLDHFVNKVVPTIEYYN